MQFCLLENKYCLRGNHYYHDIFTSIYIKKTSISKCVVKNHDVCSKPSKIEVIRGILSESKLK